MALYVYWFLFPGNVLNIFILCKQGLKKSSINIVLVSMAVADLLILLTLPLRKISLLIDLFNKALAATVENYVIGYHFLAFNRTWALISHSHVAIISVERLMAVYFPFKQLFKELREPRYMRVNFVATSVSMLFLAINSSANFIIYVYMSQKFRNSFDELCRCRCRK
ncbi:hypothetical protein PoB_001120000 [Plakobranchus ocellatus]|uniref:G-protein coupled receptors family 1 profile domain-containing protein n=1 Tax=Plakobranchus ocellatus TaxID=259542 RepID=A0AAV3YNJ6_9GAST|nr:hypothetical protein PoB_001120000 [Plakobranchus ocellatus]